MSDRHLPKTDSIEELAQFWDTHDLTDFEADLEEETEPVFDRESTFTVHLDPKNADTVRQIAESQGCPPAKLIQLWVDERIMGSSVDQAR
ncbi:MAG: CopG family antitoxin [Pirellulales bacterium]